MSNVNTSTTASTSSLSALTVDDVLKAIQTIGSLPTEPFKKCMEEAGKSPDDGYYLYLPMPVKKHFINVPHYVRFSSRIHSPIIMASMDTQLIIPKY